MNDSLNYYDLIVIIPGSGCSGCISGAEHYFLENIRNDRIKFILTYNFSKKNLSLRLGKDNISQPNVFIDDEDIFYLHNFEEKIYPIALTIDNGKIKKMKMLDELINR